MSLECGRNIGCDEKDLSAEELKKRSFAILQDDEGNDILDDHGQPQVVLKVAKACATETTFNMVIDGVLKTGLVQRTYYATSTANGEWALATNIQALFSYIGKVETSVRNTEDASNTPAVVLSAGGNPGEVGVTGVTQDASQQPLDNIIVAITVTGILA